VQTKFADKGDVSRVVTCWNNFVEGKKLDRYLDNDKKVLQTADCYVDGLRAIPFHDVNDFKWIKGLEDNYKAILDELVSYEYKRRKAESPQSISNIVVDPNLLQLPKTGVGEEGDGLWLGPRDTSGTHYGPEWKTLGLQDRSVWDPTLTLDFPKTMNIMKTHNVPSCEAFFAKQGPRSGLKPHSDKNNFIMTCHLALDVPEGECYIKVGDSIHHWKNGKTCVFDTSIFHSTENTSDRTRFVLLIRFWHPDLTQLEIEAFKFIFDFLDHANLGDEALEIFEMKQLFGKDNHRDLAFNTASSNDNSKVKAKKISNKLIEDEGIMKKEKKAKPVSKGFGSK